MENGPSPLNKFFSEKEILSSKKNSENQEKIQDSLRDLNSENQKISNINTQSNQDELKKTNIQNILSSDINIDINSSQEIINDSDILNNLKNRFNENMFFTSIHHNLIYLNSLCNEDEIFNKNIKFGNDNENGIIHDSHVYKEINNAIKELKSNICNKYSILLQGDSYSGKSKIINESIKYIINKLKLSNDYLTDVNNINNNSNNENNYFSNASYRNNGTISCEEGFYSIDNNKYNLINIPKKILAGINILEAFGSAKTDTNDNSTRVINYIKIRINKNCTKIIGMEIFPFLFDKNRISNSEEHNGYNYNIFYYLLYSENSDLLSKLMLSSNNINDYNYLKRKDTLKNNNEPSYDEIKFIELKDALITVGFNNDEILIIFKILAAIILLGNIELNLENNFKSSLNKNEILLNVCKLLNIDINEFVSGLVNQEAYNINICNDNKEIERTKNNFVNELYNQLFLWIVNKINNNINNNIISENDKEKAIIFFDFPGFENNLKNNTNYNFLEQLFINYVNELVYYFYIKDLSRDEIENELIYKKDILNSIDYLFKEIKNIQNDKQMKIYISNFIKDIKSSDNTKRKYTKIKAFEPCITNSSDSKYFIIKHSIGDILYNINDILIKNIKNFIPWNLLDCLMKSNESKIRNIYKNYKKNILANKTPNTEHKSSFNNLYSYNYENIFNNNYITFTEEFQNFIKEIKKELKQSQRNYIICIKSNSNDDPLEFESDYISQKLIFYKILPNNNNSKNSDKNVNTKYIKMKFDEFINSYENIIQKYIPNHNNIKDYLNFNHKQFLDFIEDFIKDYNNKNEDNLILNENFKLNEDDNILMKEKLYNILEQEKKSIKEEENKIMRIQSAIKSCVLKNKIKNLNSIYFFLQNSLRILCAKRKLNEIDKNIQFLLIQLKLFINKIKNKEKIIENNKISLSEKKENKDENINGGNIKSDINNLKQSENNFDINNDDKNLLYNNIDFINKNNNKIYLYELNKEHEEEKNQEEEPKNNNDKLRQKPKLKDKRISSVINSEKSNSHTEKMNQLNLNLIKPVQKDNRDNNISKNCFKILQEKLFLLKIKNKRKCTKKIFNFSYTILASRYYILMRKEIKVIQKYFKEYITREKILGITIGNYIKRRNDKLNNDLDMKINDLLFPYRNQNINSIENIKTLSKKSSYNDNNNTKDINTKNKYKMSTSERYREYKKANQFFNIKNNIKNNKNTNQQSQISIKEKNDKNEKMNKNTKNLLIKDIPNLSDYNAYYQSQKSLNISNGQIFDSGKFYDNKIYLLSKIIDIDILTDFPNNEENNELLWVQEYKKIYEFNLINRTPIQQIFLSDTHTLLMNNIGNIFLFGMNDKGQCGIRSRINNNNYISASEFLENNIINDLWGNTKEAVLKDGYTLILNKYGKTYIFNENETNFGVLNTSTYNNENSVINSTKMKSYIQSIQGGGNLNLYLSRGNEVYLDLTPKSKITDLNISYNQTNLVKLFLPNKVKICSISCGYNFYILLSTIGKLYSGGSNIFGELCSRTNIKQRMSPEEIYDVSKLNESIIQVSCGFKHVVILSEKNKVYGWGNNSFCQLFSSKKKKCGLIELNTDKKIIQIAAGFRSTFLLDEKNDIFYFGIINKNKKNIGENMERIYIEEKNNEFGNKNEFIPVKINAKWNKQFSLFYVNFADIRNISVKIEDQNHKYKISKIKYIINMISTKWLANSIRLPYIKEINQYFNDDYMERFDKIRKEIFY